MAEKLSKLDKALQLKQEYDKLMGEAKDELVNGIKDSIKQLSELGFEYDLIETKSRGSKPAASGDKKQRVCKICGQPGHNARTCPKKGKG